MKCSTTVTSALFLTDTAPAIRGELVALITQTQEGAHTVETLAVPAYLAVRRCALIHVCQIQRNTGHTEMAQSIQ